MRAVWEILMITTSTAGLCDFISPGGLLVAYDAEDAHAFIQSTESFTEGRHFTKPAP